MNRYCAFVTPYCLCFSPSSVSVSCMTSMLGPSISMALPKVLMKNLACTRNRGLLNNSAFMLLFVPKEKIEIASGWRAKNLLQREAACSCEYVCLSEPLFGMPDRQDNLLLEKKGASLFGIIWCHLYQHPAFQYVIDLGEG